MIGARKGEALALKWSDINLEKKIVRINKTITKDIMDDTAYKVTAPKTMNSNRVIDIPDNLNKLLISYKASIHDLSEDYFVFGHKRSLPFNTLRKRFVRYIEESGVKHIRIHDLRHSSVSYMISTGYNQISTIYVIANRIGDSVEQIYKTYGHLFPNKAMEMVDKWNTLKI